MRELGVKTKLLNEIRRVFMSPIFESGLVKLSSGRPPDHPWVKVLPNHYQFSRSTKRNVIRDGVRLSLDISDYMQWALYFGVRIEPRDSLYELVQKDFVVFDVGANIGETLLQFSRLVGPSGRVFGFEPSLEIYQACEENVRLNGFTNVDLVHRALGDVDQEATLCRDNSNRAGAKISKLSEPNTQGEQVRCVRLDDFVTRTEPSRLDLIKIDVEGFESKVLRGAEQTLKRFRPTLFIEVDDRLQREQGSSASGLVKYLEILGYEVTAAAHGSVVSSKCDLSGCHFDVIGRSRTLQ